MRLELLEWLRCPKCGGRLTVTEELSDGSGIKEGVIGCGCGQAHKIINYIPRFVDTDRYVDNFSFEWKKHRLTQLDSANKNDVSEKAFQSRIDFPLEELKGKLVLDVGCGMGRYMEIVKKYGGTVIGIDLSFAVDMAFENMKSDKNAFFVQADVFNLPFGPETFDFIYSFGVLHHTPDAEKAFRLLPPLLKKGGSVSIFVYSSHNRGIIYTSSFWRFFTTKLPKRLLYFLCHISIPLYFLYKIPVLGNIGKMLFVIPMIPRWKWRVLDTFDWYSPKYQSGHTYYEVYKWFESENLTDIKIFENAVTMHGTKK